MATIRTPSGVEEPCLLKRLANGHLGKFFSFYCAIIQNWFKPKWINSVARFSDFNNRLDTLTPNRC